MQAAKMFKSSQKRVSAHINTKEGSTMTRPNTRRGRGLASLAVFAVLASLLVVGATPAAAVDEDSEPDYPAETEACIGAALEARDFVDVSADHTFYDAINCLAHYGVTVGCGDGTGFCPSRTVNRWQMALFLRRAADVAGIDLGDPEEQGFTDIADLPIEWSRAINDLASAGIMPGVSSTEFNPSGDVPRKDMAVYLANFVDKASDVVTKADDGTYRLGDAEEEPNDQFCDAYVQTPRHVDSAISVIYELGITVGRGAGSGRCAGEQIFDPNGLVSRGQMAAFITRTLGHTNARPAGLTAQNVGGEVIVSVRDSQKSPIVNLSIDAFYVEAEDADRAFETDGECSRRVSSVERGTISLCEVGNDDPVTLSDGNVRLEEIADLGDEGVIVWVWFGQDGDTFDEMGTHYVKLTITPDEAPLPPIDSAAVTSNLPEGVTHARYGTRVTFTIQLQGAQDDGEMVDVPREKGTDGAVTYSLRLEAYNAPVTLDGDGFPDTDSTLYAASTEDIEIGRDGSATFMVTARDPNPVADAETNDTSIVVWALTEGIGTEDITLAEDDGKGKVTFSDGSGTVANIEIEAPAFRLAPRADRTAGNTVTISVTDQYGNPVYKAKVVLTSDADADDSGVPTVARTTNRRGEIRIGYRYSGDAGVETLTATWDAGPGEDDADPNDDPMDITGDTEVYWASIWESDDDGDASGDTPAVLNADVGGNEIVANIGTSDAPVPVVVYYDSNDYFSVMSEDGTDYVGIADFEEALVEALAAYEEAAEDVEVTGTRPTITWKSYDSGDKSAIAVFDLDTTP